MSKTLISGASTVAAYPAVSFSASDPVRTFQFVPIGSYTGTVVIEGSMVSNPSDSDYTKLVTVTFTGHTTSLTINVRSSMATVRAKITASTSGSISLYGASKSGSIVDGSKGSSPYTAMVESSLDVAGIGSSFKVDSSIVPSITTDDVYSSTQPTKTLTDVLNEKQDSVGGTQVTASGDDLNLMQGMNGYGLTTADLQKLADVTVSASEINMVSGATSNLQSQLNTLSSSIPSSLSGTTIAASYLNTFFDASPSVKVSDLNALSGMAGSVSAADLAVFAGTAGSFTAADLTKLNAVTSSAAELNKLDGFTGSTTDLNRFNGTSATAADLNAIAGYAGTGVTSTQVAFLSGLTTNVQAAINTIPTTLSSVTASADDLNLLKGAKAGTGSYSAGSISATEISYLNGLSSNIQSQLNAKRNSSTTIGIAEITGATITTTELNYLSGLTGTIQTQLNSITTSYLPLAGGTMTGAAIFAAGTAAAPAIGFTGATTTGLYLNGTDIGITIGGTAYGKIATAGLSLGTGAAGNPYIAIAGASASPHYSFNSDTGTGVARKAAGILELDANSVDMAEFDGNAKTVKFGPTAADNVTVSVPGKFEGIKLLGSTTGVNASSGGTAGAVTSIFTVPTGRTAVITQVLMVASSVAGYTSNTIQIELGFGANFDELLDAANSTAFFANATASGKVVALNSVDMANSGTSYQIASASDVVSIKTTSLQNATTYTLDVYVFGYEY